MQFITNGPDIPDALLQAHEEGRVVFFCGAGISYPAGLPGFEGLVSDIYRLNGTVPSEIELGALNRGQFDATLDLLERRLPGQRLAVRRKLAEALKPKLHRKGAVDTQMALLRLARNREGALRLVTTNFDRLFHVAAKRTGQAFQEYAAPMLPIPKNSRWNGVVYLHGLLPKKIDDTMLNRLVVSSGDFGLAYLTERWAARFVSELFRNYVVCFIGYSINDPVLRYMMDALAADRMLGEITPQAWAFGECEPGKEHSKIIEWEAKGVTPILYHVPSGSADHSAMHRTLHAWADIYRDGVLGKERIVVSHALARPSASTQQDDFVSRMLWALSDKSGLPAKRFADFNPVPSLEWLLEAFEVERFGHSDLSRFGVSPLSEVDANLHFSLICRPAPYYRAAFMSFVSSEKTSSPWDDVMLHLARWLTRHLDDPRLIFWVVQHGSQLHERFIFFIDYQLNHLSTLEYESRTEELDNIRQHAPRAIPSNFMRTIWRLLLSGRVKSLGQDLDIYHWKDRFKREGLTTTLRLELRQILTPKVELTKPFLWDENEEEFTSQKKQLVCGISLNASYIHSALQELDDEHWKAVQPRLLEDFQQLLRDALDLLRELGHADDWHDRSHWDLPSIEPHWQNRGFHNWVFLIELLRDAWLVLQVSDCVRARRIAKTWFDLPYPTFKRLALFAASKDKGIQSEVWVDWLLSDGAWWLWSTDTGREVSRLFVLQGEQLSEDVQECLEHAILAGPPRNMYRDDLEPIQWQELIAHSVWLHLAKLRSSGLSLGTAANERMFELSRDHPDWKLQTNERDEFSHWISGTGDPDYEDRCEVDIAPRKRGELIVWLKKPKPQSRHRYKDNWCDICRTRFFLSLSALYGLARDHVWPTERWREALQVWSEESMVSRAWRYTAPLVQMMPDTFLHEIAHSVTWWIKTVSKSINQHESIMLDICCRILALPFGVGTGMTVNGQPIDQPVTEAINHPIGHVTQAVLNLWFKRNPSDNDLLPMEIEPIFTQLCDGRVDRYRHGRVLLGSSLIALFRADQTWTEKYLLPLYSWDNPLEAKSVWEGFLWSPRLYQPLLIAFKAQFLDCANYYEMLGEHRQQYAAFLTYVALESNEGYVSNEFRTAIDVLPLDGLEQCAHALVQSMEGAADQSENYWKNRVLPFWRNIWPKKRDLATPNISASLTRLVIAARTEFPAAFAEVKDWLQPIRHLDVLDRLYDSGLCTQFPDDALSLLDLIVTESSWYPPNLGLCLTQVKQTEPQFEQDSRYRRLNEYIRRLGM